MALKACAYRMLYRIAQLITFHPIDGSQGVRLSHAVPHSTTTVRSVSGGGRYFRIGGGGGQAFCGSGPQVSWFALQLTPLENSYGYAIEHL